MKVQTNGVGQVLVISGETGGDVTPEDGVLRVRDNDRLSLTDFMAHDDTKVMAGPGNYPMRRVTRQSAEAIIVIVGTSFGAVESWLTGPAAADNQEMFGFTYTPLKPAL